MNISKSQYIRALQCYKSLWLLKNKPDLIEAPDAQTQAIFNIGHQVGDLAKELFPNGVEIEFDRNNFKGMLEKTKQLIASGTEVIYEATFKENGIFAMVDILVKNGDAWDIYEVKASTGVKEYHLNDASIQWYAISKRIKLNRAYIVHINSQYVRQGDLDIGELFTLADVTSEVLGRQEKIKPQILEMESMLQGKEPQIDIGHHCSEPFGCDFQSYCWSHIPEHSVFDISYAMGKQWRLYEQGILKINDVPDDFEISKNARIQIDHHKSQQIHIDKPAIKSFLEDFQYPINFFDFETFMSAIPRFDQQRPYAQMPFQYSLHILHADGQLEHKDFLGDENVDPRPSLIKQMLEDITATGSIVAYSKSFEQTQIRNLAEFTPQHSTDLLKLNDRFLDLAYPFQKKFYYHPNFHGKYSIKVVLPTLFPNHDELDYSKLGSIQDGGDAMNVFANLHLEQDKNKVNQVREDLLAYCKLDTLAMVRIWQKLGEVTLY